LIGDRRVVEPIAEDDFIALEGGKDHFIDVLSSVGEVEEKLCSLGKSLLTMIENEGANRFSDDSSPWRSGLKNRDVLTLEMDE
jgi:hypothetical protein